MATDLKNNEIDIITFISNHTGWDREETLKRLRKAQELGISYYEYLKGEYWGVDNIEDEIELLKSEKEFLYRKLSDINRKLNNLIKMKGNFSEPEFRKIQISDARITYVCQETNWPKVKVKNRMEKAAKEGVMPYSYVYHSCWKFSDEEIIELGKVLKQYQVKTKETAEYYINIICEKTGWTQNYAKQKMDEARKKGYSYVGFIKHALWKLSDAEFEKLKQVDKKINKDKIVIWLNSEERKRKMKLIMEEMGWSFGKSKIEVLRSNIIAGTTFNEYFSYKLYKYPPEEGLKYITEETAIKMRLRYCDWGGNYKIFSDKGIFSKTFEKFMIRKCFTNRELSFERFEEEIKGLEKIIVKPINELGGHGVKKYLVNSSQRENLNVYNEIMQNGDYIIEESIEGKQHSEILAVWPKTINTIRILSMYKNGEFNVLSSAIKFGTTDIIDGLIGGKGIAAGIDLETGIICTNGVDINGNVYKEHPITKKIFKGIKIPSWEKILETTEKAAKVVENMPYIGWDITVRDNGRVEIIEGNHNPAGFIVQWPFAISENEGRRWLIEPYLGF